jgi:hypothetical protein
MFRGIELDRRLWSRIGCSPECQRPKSRASFFAEKSRRLARLTGGPVVVLVHELPVVKAYARDENVTTL